MVFVRVLLAQFFVLSLQLFWNGLRVADDGNLDYENLVFNQTGMVSLICSTQEELVKRDTPPGAMRQGPRFGVSRRPGANRFCRDLEVAPLSLGVCPCGPLVCKSDRLHAKLECAGETDLPHLVSENFSKSGKLLETGCTLPPLCPPVRTADGGKVLRA